MLEIDCRKCSNLGEDRCRKYGADPDKAVKACAADGFTNYRPELHDLLELMKDHPGLPVVPMVHQEVVCDDNPAYWMGSWGHVCVDRYCRGEERIYFYDEDDVPEDAVAEVKGWDWCDEASQEEILEVYRALPWVDCIVVYIGLPEV